MQQTQKDRRLGKAPELVFEMPAMLDNISKQYAQYEKNNKRPIAAD